MKFFYILFFASSIIFIGTNSALGQGANVSNGGLSITPFLKEIEVSEEQKEKAFSLEVENNSKLPVRVSFSAADFVSMGETGGAMIVEAERNINNKHSLSAWIELDTKEVFLGSDEKKSIEVRIVNNEKLSPGGHYGVVVANIENFSEGKDSQIKDISLNSKVTSLIFVRKKGGEIYNLNIKRAEIETSFFSLPEKAKLYFENTGNVHATARGIVSVFDPFGREIRKGIINNESGIVLPGSVRLFPVELGQKKFAFLPGRYSIVTQYRYDGKDDFVTRREAFFFSPLIINIILGLLVFSIIGWLLRKKEKMKVIKIAIANTKRRTKVLMRSIKTETEKMFESGLFEKKKVKVIKAVELKPRRAILKKKKKESIYIFCKLCIGKAMAVLVAAESKLDARKKVAKKRKLETVLVRKNKDKKTNIFEMLFGKRSTKNTSKKQKNIVKKVIRSKKALVVDKNGYNNQRKLASYVFISVVVIVGMLVFYFYDALFQRPISGEIRTEPSRKMIGESVAKERFEGMYFSFRHNPAYQVNFHEKENKDNKYILERVLLSQRGDGMKRIALTVENINNRNLTDVANYNLRKKKTDIYTEKDFVAGDLAGVFFISREDGIFEKTIFIIRDQKVFQFSFSAPLANEKETENEIRDALESIQWKRQ